MQCICKLRDLDEIENKNSSLNQAIKQKFWKWIGIETQLFDDSEYILHFGILMEIMQNTFLRILKRKLDDNKRMRWSIYLSEFT